MDPILSIENLSIGFQNVSSEILFSCSDNLFAHNELVTIIGANGCGKSTFLKTIAGLLPPLKGKILIGGKNINSLSHIQKSTLFSYVSTEQLSTQYLKVRELVALGRYPYTNWRGKLSGVDNEIINTSIKIVNIGHKANSFFYQLSDGEKQKALIAKALAQDTPLLILDEPTAFLDLPSKFEIITLLFNITRERNKTVIFSSHDLNAAMQYADKMWLIDSARLQTGAPEDLMLSNSIGALFNKSGHEFDPISGTIFVKAKEGPALKVTGTGLPEAMTLKALNRAGFLINNGSKVEIVVVAQNETISWQFRYNNEFGNFQTIYDLINYIRKIKF